MYHIEVGNLKYRYLVGGNTVAILSPKGIKHIVSIGKLQADPASRESNGTSDSRVSPKEVLSYIIRNKIK